MFRQTPNSSSKKELPSSLYDYMERPKTLAPDAYWDQVRRTTKGQAFSEDQIKLLRDAMEQTLGLTLKDSLLDLCCGNGALVGPLFSRLGGYLGVDMSPVLIAVGQRDFQRSGSHEFIVSGVNDFLAAEKFPEKYTLVSWCCAFQYLSIDDATDAIHLLYKRFINVEKIFISEIPDAAKATSFFYNQDEYQLEDHTSAMGRWYFTEELAAICERLGWKAEIQKLPESFHQAYYRFSLALTR